MAINNSTKRKIVSVTITALLVILAVFANFVSIRMGTRYIIELDFYDKLSAAYEFGGTGAINKKLAEIEASSKWSQELKIAADFHKKLEGLKEPSAYFDKVISEATNKITLFRFLRIASFVLIFIILILRFLIEAKARKKK